MQSDWEFMIEWGDCDAAGIVFYPNYYRWFDAGFQRLLRLRQLDQRKLAAQYGIVGTALVGSDARYLRPLRFGDPVKLETAVTRWRERNFTVSHRIRAPDGQVAVDGHECRAWLTEDPGTGRLKSAPIPEEFRRRLS